jgi:cell division protein FtsI (penicillin-binding protein 3)
MNSEKTDILWRVFLVYSVMLLFALAVIIKTVHIQVAEGKELIEQSESQTVRYFDVESLRGNIYASDGSLLATSVPIFEIRMDAASPLISEADFNNKIAKLAQELSKLFGDRSAWEYKSIIQKARKSGNRYLLIKNNVTYEQLKTLRTFPIFDQGKNRGGLIAISKTVREKPFRSLALRTIGYENSTEDIFVGLEGGYHEILKGRDGKQLRRRINHGDWVPVMDENEVEPVNGKDIVTTIDVMLQDVAESSLHDHLIEHKADWGCAVLMEVSTGAVKAIANLSLDKKTNTYREIYNHAIGASIEPGSTFKLASMVALFEDGLDNLDDTINIGRGYGVYSGLTIQDVHGIRDGLVSIREIFEKSSNAGTSKLVFDKYSEKPQNFIDRLYQMSIQNPLDLEIPGEGVPKIKNTKDKSWSKVSLPFMSIGYELQMTPLQMLTFYNAIANNGVMVKPMFVSEVTVSGRKKKRFRPEVINRSVCSERSLAKAKEILEGVVQNGTASSLKRSPYRIAGKTGTSQIAAGSSGYDKVNYNASFVGYFPADNPKYSCIVVVSRPSTGRYYASSVAVPVFKDIADKVYATSLDMHPPDTLELRNDFPVDARGFLSDMKQVYDQLEIPLDAESTQAPWAISQKADDNVILRSRIFKDGLVPDVKGMGARDAVYLLESLGMKVNLLGRGYVREQSLQPGSRITNGSKITIHLST